MPDARRVFDRRLPRRDREQLLSRLYDREGMRRFMHLAHIDLSSRCWVRLQRLARVAVNTVR